MDPVEKAEERKAGKQNLRAAPRFQVDEDARLLLVEHGSTIACRIADLSLGGCRLRTKDRFPAGANVRVEVTFKVRGLAFRFCGITQWTDGRNLVGIRFVDLSPRRKEEFLEAVSEVEAEDAARRAAERKAAQDEEAARQAAALQTASALAVTQDEEASKSAVSSPASADTRSDLTPSRHRTLSLLPTTGRPQGASAPEKTKTGSECPAGDSSSVPQQPCEPSQTGLSLVRPTRRERRGQLREEVDTSAIIFLINVASQLRGRILDLSLGGCRIRTDERFPVGIYRRVETEFRLEGLPFRLGGVTQAIHDRQTVGIRFLDMSGRKREQLEQLIEEIEEAKRAGTKGLKD